MIKEKEKLNWITGLKGIAALTVFIHHFFLYFYPAFCNGETNSLRTSNSIELKIIKTPLNIFGWGGNFAVCLFFMISGFLIAYSYFVLNKRKQKIDSIFKRYFNLMFPILFSSVIIFFVLKSQIFRTENLLTLYKSIGLKSYYSNFNLNLIDVIKQSVYIIFNTSSAEINPPLWTMKAELSYSILSMMILYIFGKDKKRIFVYIFLLLFNINNYFSCFVLGIILSDIYYNKNEIFNKLNKKDIKLAILITGLYLASYTYLASYSKLYSILSFDLKNIDPNLLYHTIGSFLIMTFILLSDFSKRILSNKYIVKIGNLSLNIYLFHWLIINTMSMFIVLKLFKYTKYFVAVIISFIISTIVLYIISKYFDKYFKRATSFLSNKIVDFINKF